ncbi:MAG: hypothetical protein R3B51_04910 [Thermodesulfobacteriota bacterium]
MEGVAIDIDASNIVFAARAEVYPGWPLKIVAAEFGWAKGDDLSSGSVDGGLVYFNPAYNIDNLLFKNMIPNIYQVESSVYNAYYARAWGTVKLIDELSFTPQVLVAFNEETNNLYPGVSESGHLHGDRGRRHAYLAGASRRQPRSYRGHSLRGKQLGDAPRGSGDEIR